MKLGYTLNEIHVGKERTALPVHSVQAFEDEAFENLLKLNAVRVPTEAEVSIYESIHGSDKKATKAEKSKVATDTKAAADKVAGEKAAADAKDPEEVEKL